MTALPLADAIRDRADDSPDRPAVTDAHGTVSRREFDRLSDVAADRLEQLGVEHGSVVAITGSNSTRLLAAMFGIWKVGGVPLPIHTRKPAAELSDLLALAEPALAIGFDSAVHAGVDLDALFESGEQPRRRRGVLSPRLRIGASGGSSGTPKLISVDVPALVNPARLWHHAMAADGTHVVPLDVVDGTGFFATTTALAVGCHVVLMTGFAAEQLLRLIEHHAADWLALTQPGMLAVAKLPAATRDAYDVSSLRCVTHYSGGVAEWIKQVWIDWLGADRVAESYGATDARGSTWITGDVWLQRRGSVGTPHRGAEVAVFDDAGRVLAAGCVGHVRFRDLTGRRNSHAIGRPTPPADDGWEGVGDIGWLDADGFLYLADRASDMIATESGLVAPLPIEGAIEFHPGVRSAVVVGVDRGDGTTEVHAVVDAPGEVDATMLEQMLATSFPEVRIPDSWSWWDAPLRDNAGKAQRRAVRDAVVERVGRR